MERGRIEIFDNRRRYYAVFPDQTSGAACAIIDFQDGVTEPNGCQIEDLVRVVLARIQDVAHVDHYGAIKQLQSTLEYLKREKPIRL